MNVPPPAAIRVLATVLLVAPAVLFGVELLQPEVPAPRALTGRWQGAATRFVQDSDVGEPYVVRFAGQPDGTVAGRVGDATFSGARMVRARGPIGRALKLDADFHVLADLRGPVSPGVTCERLTLYLRRDNGWAGAIEFSGCNRGGGWLSAPDVRFEPQEGP
jgi:hypothetical protein